METVDELMTPGCPQCAVKHLSAAVSILASLRDPVANEAERSYMRGIHGLSFEAGVLLAQAHINFVEVAEGYASHFDYAVGLLNRAEEDLVCNLVDIGNAMRVRRIRTDAILRHDAASAAASIVALMSVGLNHRWCAHQREAVRELPSFDWDRVRAQYGQLPIGEYFQNCISEIRKEYFENPDIPEKGGEGTMACAKKTAKPVAKATKAACKGGKCAAKKGCK